MILPIKRRRYSTANWNKVCVIARYIAFFIVLSVICSGTFSQEGKTTPNHNNSILFFNCWDAILRVIRKTLLFSPGNDVTQCGWYDRQTISLSVLARNPNKGIELEISNGTGSGWRKEGPRKDRGELTKKDWGRQSTTDSRRDQLTWDSSPGDGRSAEGGSEGRQSKNELAHLVAL